MNKIKVIDLLNMISKGEEVPKKIKITNIDDRITRKYNFFYDEDDQEYKDDELFPLGARLILDRVLNDKVEIIEEEKKIPEKLKWVDYNTEFTHGELNKEFRNICNTIDEIIDYLKSKGDK